MPSHPPPGPSGPLDLIATSTFGLEAVVARELQHMGYEPKILQSGRILFPADAAAVCRANLWLRAADRVLLRVGSFEATDFGQLFDRTYALPWEQWIPAGRRLPRLGPLHQVAIVKRAGVPEDRKKAVVEKLKAAYATEWFAESGAKFSIEVALLDDRATLTIDTTGPGLHKRGYRALVGKAPLKETLAAAMVLLSYWKPQRPLVDPFCGTGTIPIEAALIGCNMAPGAADVCGRVVAGPAGVAMGRGPAGRPGRQPGPTRRCASLGPTWTRRHCDWHATTRKRPAWPSRFTSKSGRSPNSRSKRPYGCVICNPPYGQRMGRQAGVCRPSIATCPRSSAG